MTVVVENRRKGLQNFLTRVSLHPVLSESEHFVTFLESGYLAPAKKEATERSRAASGTGSSWAFSRAKQAVTKPKEMEVTGFDTQIEEAGAYIKALEPELKVLCVATA